MYSQRGRFNELFTAISEGNDEEVRLLIDEKSNLLNQLNSYGWSPLMDAAWNRRLSEETISIMIEKTGLDTLKNVNYRGFSLLQALARSGYASCITKLLKKTEVLNVNQRTTKEGNTPLHFCMFNVNVTFEDRYVTAKTLIQSGANAELKNKRLMTPVDEYAKFQNIDTPEQIQQMLLLLATDTHGTVKVRKLSIKNFMTALEEGKEKADLIRLMVMGNERVGKSCLVDSLLGKKFEENKTITDAIAITKASTIDGKIWKESDESGDHIKRTYVKGMVQQLRKGPHKDESESMKDTKRSSAEDGAEPRMKRFKVEEANEGKHEYNLRYRVSTEEYTEITRKLQEQSPERAGSHKTKSDDMSSIEIWDFGGQLVYQSIQRLFLTPAAVYFVVFKLNEDLDATAKVSDACGVQHYTNMTNLEFLLYLIRSIFTHAVSLDDDGEQEIKTPNVFIVGTHRDSISSHENEKTAKVNEIWTKIQEAIKGKAYESLVYPQLFDTDNKHSASGNITELKKILWETKQKMLITIPLKWLKLQMELQKRSKTNVTMTYEEVKKLASTFGIRSDESTKNVLTFLHDLGQVLFFPEVLALKDNVVINPLMLVDMYKTVNTVLKPNDLGIEYEECWKQLEKGILEKKLLKHLWLRLDDKLIFDFHVALIQKFGLICESKTCQDGIQYLVPSRFQLRLDNKMQSLAKWNQAVTCFFDFQGYLPDDLPHQVFAQALNVFKQESENVFHMSTEQVVLNLDEYHILSLAIVSVKKRRMLQMTIVSSTLKNERKAMKEPSPQVCKNALNEIEQILQKLRIGRRQRYEFQIVISCSKEYNNLSKSHLHLLDICKQKEMLPCGCRGFETARFKRLFLDDTSMTETLSDIDLLNVCKSVSGNWKQLAIRLGFSLAEIHCIAADNKKIEDAALQMLVKWRQKQESTVNTLFVMRNALREQEYVRVAEQLGRDNQFSHSWEGYLDDIAFIKVGEGIGDNYLTLALSLGVDHLTVKKLEEQNYGRVKATVMDILTHWRNNQLHEVNLLLIMCSALKENKFVALSEQLQETENYSPKGFLNDRAMHTICTGLGNTADWIGLGLELKYTWRELKLIKAEYSDMTFMVMEMLTVWRERQTSSTNQFDEMKKALIKCDLSKLADKLEDVITSSKLN